MQGSPMRVALLLCLLAAPVVAQEVVLPDSPMAQARRGAEGAQAMDRFFAGVDADRDGVITEAEWQASGRGPQGFLMMDANGDRRVTVAEAQKAMDLVMDEPVARPERPPPPPRR
jgi:hypothetical protein